MTCSRCVVLAVAVVLSAGAWACAQPAAVEPAAIRGDLPQTRKRLSEAEQKILNGHAADAVEDLQRILDEAGDDFVTIDGKQYRAARWYAHQILGKLPPELLKAYQARIDEPARKLLEAGQRDRDVRPLRELLERYFVSRPAQEGLLLLGDLLFERGDFRMAELQWRRLLPPAASDLHYPAAAADSAAVHARIILAAIFEGELDRARSELAEFQKSHPGAAGTFAGKTGSYAEILQGFLDRPPRLASSGDEKQWPTFGGNPERSGRTGGAMPYHWPTRPTWRGEIPADNDGRKAAQNYPPIRQPFGYPIVAEGKVFLSDGRRVFSFSLKTGERKTVLEIPQFLQGGPRPTVAEPDGWSSVTFASGRLYARLGPSLVRPPKPAEPGGKPVAESAIACFVPVVEEGEVSPRFRGIWQVAPPEAEGRGPAVWEGAPLVAGRRMWAALARFEGGRVVHSIACYDPADPAAAPERPAWVAEVCDSPLSSGSDTRTRQELLTLAGPNIVFCSNTGAVAAVNAVSGRRAWAFSYPRNARLAAEAIRSPEPAPAVAAGGRVFVAPADGDRVYALEAETGELLWESGLAEGARIVGISRDRVIITVSGQVRGIRALNVRTGSHRPPEGWVQHNGGGMLTYGRGLVTDDVIVWPSEHGLYFLGPESGEPLALYRTMPSALDKWYFGHVAYADGVMVVVTPTQVWGYEADGPARPRPEVRPADPRAAFQAMVDAAETELARGEEAKARELLAAAMRADFPSSWRAWAAARLLLLSPRVDAADRLPRDFRDNLDPALAREWLLAADGQFVSLGTLIDHHTGRAERPATAPATLLPEDPAVESPSLSRTARVRRTARIPAAAFPLQPIAGCSRQRNLFVASVREIASFPLDGGAESRHVAADAFTHAADLADGFVAAGPYAVAVYCGDPEPAWVFRMPDTDPLPTRPGLRFFRGGEPNSIPQMSSFALSGSSLFARLGERHLIALDLKGRRVAWVLATSGRPCYEPRSFPAQPRFEPQFLVAGRLLIAQLSHGRRWTIDAATGRIRTDPARTDPEETGEIIGQTTALVPWVHPPLQLDDSRVAFSDGPGLVRLIHPGTGRIRWTQEVEGESSLAGEPPQLRRWDKRLILAVRRNYAVEIDRIDPFDGKSIWPGPVLVDASRVDLASADADDTQLYIAAGGKLSALSLSRGKSVWEAELPAAKCEWIVRAGRRVVIAYPRESIAAESMNEVLDRVTRSFTRVPLPWRLPWLAAAAYDPWTSRTLPVLLLDPETGEILKRLAIPARGPFVAAYFDRDRAVIATGDRVVWVR